ncbi:MAG TPA: putative zinc-binding metallopeptidase [Ilumatobacteraceae bacterium]|nr:putative zinc-binding metallopeptidase [Ilumatobacteraceae bacterium]
MKRLHCPTCANEVFFDSLDCVRCQTGLVIDIDADLGIDVADVATIRPCVKRGTWACNWRAVAADAPLCRSCVLVDAGDRQHEASMVPFQSAQRRALYQLSELGVPWGAGSALRFAYRSKSAGDDAVIGHRSGEITLDLDEADPASRERIRATLGEHYRTPLGHIRHELGHFVWLKLVASDPDRLGEFRELFGDEREDYSAALDSHYGRLDDGAWRDAHASFYASAHPWEDFAESWAQLMHVHDVVETGAEWGVVTAPDDHTDATAWLATSITASVAANELARSMGMRDLYPFALTSGVRAKVEFCWRLLPVRVA